MLINKKANLFLISTLIIIVFSYSYFKTKKNDKNEERLKLANNFVIGEITNYEITGDGDSRWIYYEYNVTEIKYYGSINNSFKYFFVDKTYSNSRKFMF